MAEFNFEKQNLVLSSINSIFKWQNLILEQQNLILKQQNLYFCCHMGLVSRISYLVLRVAFRVSNFELIIFTIMHHASRITHHPGAER